MVGRAQALVLSEPRKLEEVEVALPEIGDDDALLRVEACGLCGTDHEAYTGMWETPYRYVPGHETVGVVAKIGPGAARRWGVREGQRVAVEPFQSCGRCETCRSGDYRHCERHGRPDAYGFQPLDRAPGLWGGYAQYHYLAPDSMLVPVPDSLDPVVATLFNPLGGGFQWAVKLPRTRPGDVVAVLGPGVRGLSACAAAKSAGAGFVMVTGAGAQDAHRLELAPTFGADLAVDVTTTDPVQALKDATGGSADVVVDVTAGAPSAFNQAIDLARKRGTVVVAGVRGRAVPDFWPDYIVSNELTLLGTVGVDGDSYRAAFDLLDEKRYPFAELPRRTAGFDGAGELLLAMAGESADGRPVHGVIVP